MQRKLKVYHKWVTPTGNPYSYNTMKRVPKIVLSGKWLESLGFEPGDTIHVHSTREGISIYKEAYELESEQLQ